MNSLISSFRFQLHRHGYFFCFTERLNSPTHKNASVTPPTIESFTKLGAIRDSFRDGMVGTAGSAQNSYPFKRGHCIDRCTPTRKDDESLHEGMSTKAQQEVISKLQVGSGNQLQQMRVLQTPPSIGN